MLEWFGEGLMRLRLGQRLQRGVLPVVVAGEAFVFLQEFTRCDWGRESHGEADQKERETRRAEMVVRRG